MTTGNLFNEFREYPAIIKIIGVGGAGGNAVNRMIESHIKGVEFIAANTDAQALRSSLAGLKLQLGMERTKGLGVGGDPEVGRNAAVDDKEKIKEVLVGADMVFITAGMGGGTGTGAAPVVAEIAKELGILVVGVITKPFIFEGRLRNRHAEEGVKKLSESVDTMISIPNQRLFTVIDENTSADKAWEKVDDVLRQGVQSISDVITSTGIINVDFNDVKAIMKGAGEALMGMGEGEGEGRATLAAEMAMSSPLLEDVSINGACGVLVNITGSRDLKMYEINEAMSLIHDSVSPDANVYFGQVFDDTLKDKIKITVIATSFDRGQKLQRIELDHKKNIFKQSNMPFVDSTNNINEPAFLRKNKKKLW
ncbi:cell division protein FtsZ [bacterium]